MNNENSITIRFNLRIVCIVLALIILGMLAAWRPWQHTATAATRKITISGSATVKATPDEFVFYPSFERTGTDMASMKDDLNNFGNKLLGEVQKLGVSKNDIRLDSSSYDYYYGHANNGQQTITLQATITAHSKDIAQKVQDYLAATDAKGQLTAQPQFSDTKQKQLESTARLQAIADARKKADQTASTLGAKIGKVLEVSDQSTARGIIAPLAAGSNLSTDAKSSLQVTPGTDEVTGDVQVVFALD